MSPITSLVTNLKSIKFGTPPANDRQGLGNSSQPYVTTEIPETTQPNYQDFLLRGGINAYRDTLTDLERLTKYFTDRNSPSGMLFTVKQNTLSRIATRTQASGIGVNEGVYTFLNTLAQAGISFDGGHTPKQGSVPLKGPNTYLNTLKKKTLTGTVKIIGDEEGSGNRLVDLTELKINESLSFNPKALTQNQISPLLTEVLNYGGGPNSIGGIGRTHIKLATDPKGAPIRTVDQVFKINDRLHEISDFRRGKLQNASGSSTIRGLAPSYNPSQGKTIDNNTGRSRINYTSPGQRGNVIDYSQGKLDLTTGKAIGPVDRVNALPIYRSSAVVQDPIKNDLIKFRIAAIDNNDPSLKDFIHFRAFIDSFSDSYNASWNSQKYMGRGESFYKYDSFSRDINLSFTVAAQSREEIMIMYKKLNFLASNLAPSYSTDGYMGGSLVQLTLGGWCYELPGFIKSLTLDVPQESPWEIGIPSIGKGEEEFGGIKYRDSKVKEMPMICRITGFTFTPIHEFRPEKQNLDFGSKKDVFGADGKPTGPDVNPLTGYGKQRFIQLDDGGNNDAYETVNDLNFINKEIKEVKEEAELEPYTTLNKDGSERFIGENQIDNGDDVNEFMFGN